MSSNTNFLDLLMKDPVADKDDTFNIETMLNENWRKIDTLLGMLAGHGDNLAKLSPAAKYMEHWWYRRRAAGDGLVIGAVIATSGVDKRVSILYSASGDTETEVIYADAVRVNKEGVVELVDPVTVVTTYNKFEEDGLTELLRGKYVARACPSYSHMGPLYIPEGSSIVRYNSSIGDRYFHCYPSSMCNITTDFSGAPWEWVYSKDREAYPDRGVLDGYEYRYSGVPMERTVSGAKIVSGSYVGTGTCGDDHPNSLDFPFDPKLVIVMPPTGSITSENIPTNGSGFIAIKGMSGMLINYNGNSAGTISCSFEWVGNGLQWAGASYTAQCNITDITYYYVAIG